MFHEFLGDGRVVKNVEWDDSKSQILGINLTTAEYSSAIGASSKSGIPTTCYKHRSWWETYGQRE